MEHKKGVMAVVYDDDGKMYFLLLKREKDWTGYEFPKSKILENENEEDALKRILTTTAGLTKAQLSSQLEDKRIVDTEAAKREYSVYLIKSSMNLPVTHSKRKHNSYIWTDVSGVRDRLVWSSEKEIFEKSLEEIKLIQET